MSEFFISGFSESGIAPLSLPSPLDVRAAELSHHARLELARFEFGALDRMQGRKTEAARALTTAIDQAGRLSHSRARHRARSYHAVEGREHCPHCWVFTGEKRPLAFIKLGLSETARCTDCGSQYQLAAL